MITIILSGFTLAVAAAFARHRDCRARLYLVQLVAIAAVLLIVAITRAAIFGDFNECVLNRTGASGRSVAEVNP